MRFRNLQRHHPLSSPAVPMTTGWAEPCLPGRRGLRPCCGCPGSGRRCKSGLIPLEPEYGFFRILMGPRIKSYTDSTRGRTDCQAGSGILIVQGALVTHKQCLHPTVRGGLHIQNNVETQVHYCQKVPAARTLGFYVHLRGVVLAKVLLAPEQHCAATPNPRDQTERSCSPEVKTLTCPRAVRPDRPTPCILRGCIDLPSPPPAICCRTRAAGLAGTLRSYSRNKEAILRLHQEME